MIKLLKLNLVIAVLTLISCVEDGEFENTPNLTFKGYEVFETNSVIDSAVYTFKFEDGDGDIGSEDSTEFNCFLIYEELHNDSVITFEDIENRTYSLPNLTPKAKDKSIEGEISLKIKPAPIYNIQTDSLYRYSCYIIDRSGKISNTIFCPWQQKN